MPRKSKKNAPDGKVRMTFDEYLKIVEKCETIEGNRADALTDPKLSFARHDNWPTVQQLEEHAKEIESRFSELLPYFVYLVEVFEPESDDKDNFKDVVKYIKQLMNEHLIIKEEGEE